MLQFLISNNLNRENVRFPRSILLPPQFFPHQQGNSTWENLFYLTVICLLFLSLSAFLIILSILVCLRFFLDFQVGRFLLWYFQNLKIKPSWSPLLLRNIDILSSLSFLYKKRIRLIHQLRIVGLCTVRPFLNFSFYCCILLITCKRCPCSFVYYCRLLLNIFNSIYNLQGLNE